ncbi:hypothetical protein [Psychroflexus salis]|nr:hypothetical protein [Psychroflexus salis]
MKLSKSTWLYMAAAIITLYGIITGFYLFIFLAFPVGLFGYQDQNKK